MKKLMQIALVVILICVLFQTVADGSMVSPGKVGSNAGSQMHLTEATDLADVYAAGCLVRIKGVICVRPNVGWNT